MALDQKVYRRYHAGVERALALFDANSDWADHIAFLSRLLKSLDTGKPEGLTDIPCKARIALCLSRCLQPTLPSGVHQKALDAYSEVFMIVGDAGLSRDLPLYLPGLSHALAFANLSTRPMILTQYENHILRLSVSSLRPALKALILSLLPVIEEETSEDFDRCLHTFDSLRLRFAVDEEEYFFWQTLFVASISNPLRRGGVLVYLGRYLPKLNMPEQHINSGADSENPADVIVTPEPGLLVRCFATGLRDEQPLIQRGFLDLLVTHLPLSADILQATRYQKDLDVLVSAAMLVVLRRDMSLNRRLWTWFSGAHSKSSDGHVTIPMSPIAKQVELRHDYFTEAGLAPVIRSIESMLTDNTLKPGPRTLPFRVLASLMDRWDIAESVVRATFALFMKTLMSYQSSAPTQAAFDEVFRSANVFFDGIESTSLFACMVELLHTDQIELLKFVVSSFNIEQADMAHLHLTNFSIDVAGRIVDDGDRAVLLATLLDDLTGMINATTPVTLENTSKGQATLVLKAVSKVVGRGFAISKNSVLLAHLCAAFDRTSALAPVIMSVSETDLIQKLDLLVASIDETKQKCFAPTEAATRVLTSLLYRSKDLSRSVYAQLMNNLPALVNELWTFLSTNTPQYHVASVEAIWRLHDVSEEGTVQSAILELMCHATNPTKPPLSEDVERFGVLYHHTKILKRAPEDNVPNVLCPIMLRILDCCQAQDRAEAGVRWLLSLNNVSPILRVVLDVDMDDVQNAALAFARVEKAVHILYMSEDNWRSFSASADIVLTHEFCLQLVDANRYHQTSLAHDAFVLLRLLYGTRSGNAPSDELLSLLVQKLDTDAGDARQQEDVLDTLLAILNDKSRLPSSLVKVLLEGLSTIPVDERLDKWITLLCNFLPNHSALLPSLLKVTSAFCKRIQQTFDDLQALFNEDTVSAQAQNPEKSIANLLSGLEYVLARAHQQVFHVPQGNSPMPNGTPQESVSSRSKANDRLTVILCMQDAVRICAKLWLWKSLATLSSTSDSKSFQYTAMKLRSRSRKILENLIEAEPQECLETLISLWADEEQSAVLDLLQTLNGARPRSMMPTIFNAIYSRTNPAALSSHQKSSLSIEVGPLDLVNMLNDYTAALEDDMLEEIWTDCATFLKEVLANPMPHRQILIQLLRYCSTLAIKMENTNFAEESRMQRELADICTRLVTAILTIKPSGYDGTVTPDNTSSKSQAKKSTKDSPVTNENMLTVLVNSLPHLAPLLSQFDRSNTVFAGLASHITTPAFHARNFPENLSFEHLEVMRMMSTGSKVWKKDLLDAVGNARFFSSSRNQARLGWLPLLRQLQVSDKAVVGECLNRIAPPAAAGIMLGIGAATARTEADRRTQLELRKITTFLLAADTDAVLPHLQVLSQKIEELFSATLESSPSLVTRGDVYLLVRALLLKTSHGNLSQLWPILDAELQHFCKDLLARNESVYTTVSQIQGAKLFDLLLLIRPDEFQLHEWLYVNDTIDAIYPSSDRQSRAYADEIAPVLNAGQMAADGQTSEKSSLRRPWLHGHGAVKGEEADGLLASFFSQLSIRRFEEVYSLQALDEEACLDDLLADVFTDVGA